MASLVVPCPKCPAKLAAPDSAVGKRIRCPKCGALATVPALVAAEEVKVVEAKVVAKAAAPPTPKPAAAPAPKSDVNVTCCIACNTMIATIGKAVDGVIRCPKCGLPNAARAQPGADEDDEDDRPRKKKVRAAAVEDDEDDRPRRKRRPRDEDDEYDHDRKRKPSPKRKTGGALIAGLVVGGVLLLCVGAGLAVYLLGGKGGVFAKKAPVPPGWEEYKYPQDGFRLYAPKGANYTSVPVNELVGGFGGRPRFNNGRWDWDNNLPAVERFATLGTGDWNAPAQVTVQVVTFRDRLPASVRDAVRRTPTNMAFGGVEMRAVKWLGYDAVEQTTPNGVTRVAYTDRHLVSATISGPNMTRARPEDEAAFFDNFEITE
jgi:DNA-directed RNA polymerase subunit M/transcription elongation factor TFIIS